MKSVMEYIYIYIYIYIHTYIYSIYVYECSCKQCYVTVILMTFYKVLF
jgi:hypothetical protein